MAKMNMGAVASKVTGIAAGLAVGGALQRYIEKTGASDSVKEFLAPLAMIVAGAYAPNFMGKSDVLDHAATAIMTKGVNTILVKKFGGTNGFLAGLDDDTVSGYDDEVSGYPTSDDVIVSGPYDEAPVSGIGQYIN